MKSCALFWGFQDIKLVSLIAKRLKHQLSDHELCVQILPTQKTISLVDVNPEEIIRTEYTLENLYQWLTRNSFKNKKVFIVVDLFNFIYREPFEQNLPFLKLILALPFQFFFLGPKPLTFSIEDRFLQRKTDNLLSRIKSIVNFEKQYFEVILNSQAQCQYAAIPIPDKVVLHDKELFLFETRRKLFFHSVPSLGKYLGRAGVLRETISTKLSEKICNFFNSSQERPFLVFFSSDISIPSTSHKEKKNFSFILNFYPAEPNFFGIKSQTNEHKFLMWLIFKLIAEFYST